MNSDWWDDWIVMWTEIGWARYMRHTAPRRGDPNWKAKTFARIAESQQPWWRRTYRRVKRWFIY